MISQMKIVMQAKKMLPLHPLILSLDDLDIEINECMTEYDSAKITP